MRFFAATTVAALSLLSAVSATPSVYSADIEARSLAERQLATITVGPVDLGAQVLLGPATCPPVDSNGITLRTFAAVSIGERVATSVDLAGGLVRINGVVTANALVCACVRVGIDTTLADLPLNIQAQALDALRLAADTGVVTDLTNFLGGVTSADVQITPTLDREDCGCPVNSQPTCANGACGCIPCPDGQVYNSVTGVCVPTPSGLTRRRALSFGRDSHGNLRQAKRADIVERLRARVA